MKKKLLAIALFGAMLLSLAACGSDSRPAGAPPDLPRGEYNENYNVKCNPRQYIDTTSTVYVNSYNGYLIVGWEITGDAETGYTVTLQILPPSAAGRTPDNQPVWV